MTTIVPKITIMSRAYLLADLAAGKLHDATHAVSITSATPLDKGNFTFPTELARFPHIHLAFDDASNPRTKDGPTMGHILHLCTFATHGHDAVAKHGQPHVLFHCSVGVSRSPAAALILLVALGLTPRDAAIHLAKSLHHRVHPNKLMLALGSKALGFASDTFLQAWGNQ